MTPIYHGMKPTVKLSAGLKLSAYEKEKIKAINNLEAFEMVERRTQNRVKARGSARGYQVRESGGALRFQVYREYNGERLYFLSSKREESAQWLANHTTHAINQGTLREMWKLFKRKKYDEAIKKYGDPELSGSFSQYF